MSPKLDKSADVISRMFTSLAPRYDLMNDIMTGFTHRRTRKFTLKLLRKDKIARALDLASGTGDFAFLLQSFLNSDTLIIGSDFSSGMLKTAQYRWKNIQSKLEANNLTFFLSDINHLPFKDESFDICTISYGLRNVQEPVQVLQEIHRITHPSGSFLILESILPRNSIIRYLLSFYFRKVVPRVARLFSSHVKAYDYYFQSVKQFLPSATVLKLLRKTHWKRVTIYSLLFGSVIIYQIFKR
ncbi:MAG: ubiquinone/menaquinone biosynthesis methyltransferase [Candidatus Hodarchaeales archaeon]|jgi:demethylmenaquinone methyltransferase/2-methoxy-6-polyprenyl-1,4-benzoquinol methylase